MKSSTNIVQLSPNNGSTTNLSSSAHTTRLLPRAVDYLVSLGRRIFSIWRSLLLHNATIYDLRCLDDRMLRDIGIERDQIEMFVAKHSHSNSSEK